MKKSADGYYRLHTQGFSRGELKFSPNPATCGDIKNGVALCIRGGWGVVSFTDLEEMVNLSKYERKQNLVLEEDEN